MKTKKTKKANLENFRTLFFQIGIVITLAAILFAFEWKSSVKIEKLQNSTVIWTDGDVLPPVILPKPEIKVVKPPAFNIVVVDDNKDIVGEEDLLDLLQDIEDFQIIDYGDIVEEDEVVNDEPVLIAEFMPTFQGKDVNSFRGYISENIKFPERAKEAGISGTVYASFVVNKDGSVTDVQIIRGVHPDVDKAVVKVIQSSPKWEPGMNNGQLVKVRYTIPVAFKLI